MFQHFPKYITPASKIKYTAASTLFQVTACLNQILDSILGQFMLLEKYRKAFILSSYLYPMTVAIFLPFKWKKYKINIFKSYKICLLTPKAAVLLQINRNQQKYNEKQRNTLKKL